MKKILSYFREHLKEDFHPAYYGLTALLLAGLIWVNYGAVPGKKLEVLWVVSTYGTEWAMLRFFCWYTVPYFLTVGLYVLFHKQAKLLQQREFWIRALVGLIILSLDGGFYYHRLLLEHAPDLTSRYILTKWLVNMNSIWAMGIPLLIFWWVYEKRKRPIYGLSLQGFDARPYFVLLLLMVPIVVTASFGEDFIRYYPTMKPEAALRWTVLPAWLTMSIFEFVYLADFLWTEVIFRGFMVVGMIRVMGKGAVLPMVSIYAVRHFAKPMMESVGSVFGGYILGVIAFRSKNILGGVLIHMGIAFLMDLMALLHHWHLSS